ncbi:MAG: 3-keto-disaccharide hydrolase [Sphingobacteriaceae bacterium]
MKLILTATLVLCCIGGVAQNKVGKDGWIKLFNGKDLNNWDVKIKGHPLNENFGNTFRVQNGNLAVNYDQYGDWNEQYGHIFNKQKFSAYLLVMEYRFTGEQVKGGAGWAYRNSGAMLHSQPASTMKLDQDFPISLEEQLLGGDGSGERSTANLCTPGTNVILKGNLYRSHCVNSTSKTYNGDQWVRVEALVLGDSIIHHIVEGDTVLTYQKSQIDGSDGLVDPVVYRDKQLLKDGYISLQSESHPVEFRKVELFNLEKYMSNPKKLQSKLAELKKRKDH